MRHNAADRRVLAKVDSATNKANATVQTTSQGRTSGIMDRDTRNNTCACRQAFKRPAYFLRFALSTRSRLMYHKSSIWARDEIA